MRCPSCREKVQKGATICRFCGSSLAEVNEKRKKKRKYLLLSILGFLILCIFITAIANGIEKARITRDPAGATIEAINRATDKAKPTSTKPKPTNIQVEPTEIPTKEIEPSVLILVNSAGLTEEEATKAFTEIQKVGLDVVISMELITEFDQMKFYQANVAYTKPATISFVNSELFGITMGDNIVLYDADAGGVIDNVENYKLTDEQKSQYIAFAEMTVKKALKAPSTAKFPGWLNWSDWEVWRDKDAVWLKSWVDAQNSFGAMIRSGFVMQFDYETTELIYFELDGQVLYGSIRE